MQKLVIVIWQDICLRKKVYSFYCVLLGIAHLEFSWVWLNVYFLYFLQIEVLWHYKEVNLMALFLFVSNYIL